MKATMNFRFVNTEAEAVALTEQRQAQATRYMRKKHPAHFTPWESQDRSTKKFVVFWYD